MENSSTNLSSLPEEESPKGETAAHSGSKLPSAFSSNPDRPPIQYVLDHFSRFFTLINVLLLNWDVST